MRKNTDDSPESRIARLRRFMKSHRYDFYIVYTADPHLSEYISETDKLREYLTGFTGSAGTLLVSATDACLWVDGRYHIQAQDETKGTFIRIMKMGEKNTVSLLNYLIRKCSGMESAVIGLDGRYISAAALEKMRSALPKNVSIDCNAIIDAKIWPQRPPRSFKEVRLLNDKVCAEDTQNKLSAIREKIRKNCGDHSGAYHYIVSDLCSIMWITNLRGNDISYVPVAFSYLIINEEDANIYINRASLSPAVENYLEQAGIKICSYSDFYDAISGFRDERVIFDKRTNNGLISELSGDRNKTEEISDSDTIRKDIKSPAETEAFRKYHIRDAVSVIRFIKDLKSAVSEGKEDITEYDAALMMDRQRLSDPDCYELSFETISAYGRNAALPHYSAKETGSLRLKNEGLYLVDCGGHYPSCTTDITRTIALGELTEKEKIYYTAVLKGNLALMDAVFLEGTRGENLDVLARGPLWKLGIDYKHGTGHGIGAELSVHEGPLAVRTSINKDFLQPPLAAGMVLSDEPGVYIENEFGIRIENELLVVPAESTDGENFLKFEVLTLVPFETDAIVTDMLNETEISLINAYHKKVYDTVSPLLEDEEKKWLAVCTKPIENK